MTAHAKERAIERYGQQFSHHRLLEKISAGQAKLVNFGRGDTLIYDVPYRSEFNTYIVVRLVVNCAKDRVITILPPQTPGQIAQDKLKPTLIAAAKRKRKFFKRFEDDEDCVTV
jgi:hypothetical protein